MNLIIGSLVILAIVAAAYAVVVLIDLFTRDEKGFPKK